MPEGPEVTSLSAYIQSHVEGKLLDRASIVNGRYKNHGAPTNFTAFTKALPLKCEKVSKKGKVLFLYFEGGWCLISKLGMTGWWYMKGDEPTWHRPVENILLEFGGETLVFSDVRNYGTLTVTKEEGVIEKELNKLAPDIMDGGTTFDVFQSRLEMKKRSGNSLLEDALVDQQLFVSGIGNYLKSEILYDAKISPLRRVKDVSADEWKTIFDVGKKTTARMMRALKYGDEESYTKAMKVYMRDVDPHGNAIHVHKTKAGRSTFWVPSIQH